MGATSKGRGGKGREREGEGKGRRRVGERREGWPQLGSLDPPMYKFMLVSLFLSDLSHNDLNNIHIRNFYVGADDLGDDDPRSNDRGVNDRTPVALHSILGGITESDNAVYCDTSYRSVVCLYVAYHTRAPCRSRWTE